MHRIDHCINGVAVSGSTKYYIPRYYIPIIVYNYYIPYYYMPHLIICELFVCIVTPAISLNIQ
jgi:hypothetical protein